MWKNISINSNLEVKVDAISGKTSEAVIYEEVTGIGYDSENKKLMIKVGASTEPIPFSSKKSYSIRMRGVGDNPCGYWVSSEHPDTVNSFVYASWTDICDGIVSYAYLSTGMDMVLNVDCYVDGVLKTAGTKIIENTMYGGLNGLVFFVVPV